MKNITTKIRINDVEIIEGTTQDYEGVDAPTSAYVRGENSFELIDADFHIDQNWGESSPGRKELQGNNKYEENLVVEGYFSNEVREALKTQLENTRKYYSKDAELKELITNSAKLFEESQSARENEKAQILAEASKLARKFYSKLKKEKTDSRLVRFIEIEFYRVVVEEGQSEILKLVDVQEFPATLLESYKEISEKEFEDDGTENEIANSNRIFSRMTFRVIGKEFVKGYTPR